jgi:uncharacterized membrane protein (DUF2068 family)
MNISHDRLLRLIALFKFIKAALLIAVGIGALKLLHKDLAATVEHCITALKLDPGAHLFNLAVGKAARVRPDQMKKVSVGSFVYAGLFLAEGTGLWLRKRWGEWLTVIITSSLVPIEIYEMFRHFSIIKVVVLLLNLAIVGYLIYHIRTQPQGRAARRG